MLIYLLHFTGTVPKQLSRFKRAGISKPWVLSSFMDLSSLLKLKVLKRHTLRVPGMGMYHGYIQPVEVLNVMQRNYSIGSVIHKPQAGISQSTCPMPHTPDMDLLLHNPGEEENISFPPGNAQYMGLLGAAPLRTAVQLRAAKSGLPSLGKVVRIWPKGWSPPTSPGPPISSLPSPPCSTLHPTPLLLLPPSLSLCAGLARLVLSLGLWAQHTCLYAGLSPWKMVQIHFTMYLQHALAGPRDLCPLVLALQISLESPVKALLNT